LLQAIENMQEASLGQTLDAIEKLARGGPDLNRVKDWIDGHAKDLHGKLDKHSKELHTKHDDAIKALDGVPDHDAIMKGVHGLLADHMSDHSGKMMNSINKLPLPPDEKVLLQAIENMQEASLGQTLDAIEKLARGGSDLNRVKDWIDGHAKDLHGKLDKHAKDLHGKHDDAIKALNGMPEHDDIMKGVHGLLADHIGDHAGKIMNSINKMPLPADEKILLQAIENMHEASLGQTLEAIEKLKKAGPDLKCVKDWIDGSSKELHGKLDGHSKKHEAAIKALEGMPDHDTLMKGVHGLLADHIGDHAGKIMNSINKMPLPPDEKVLLQAIENMHEASLGQTLEAIEKLRKSTPDLKCVKDWIDGSSKDLHGKLDGHSKKHEAAIKALDGMPDHDTLMKGVHGLLASHMNDHSGKIMNSINKLPLPPDEKILLQAIENMQEASLGQTMGEIKQLRKEVAGHTDSLHGKFDQHGKLVDDLLATVEVMPDHDTLMKGVHGLLSSHIGDHSGKVMSEIGKLPIPADEKIMLQAIENMEESLLGTLMGAIESLEKRFQDHSGELKNHGQAVKGLQELMDGMPEHDSIMKGVHGLLSEHIGDGHGKIMSEINSLPLPPDEKLLLQAIENMEETMLTTILEAINNISMNVTVRNTLTGAETGSQPQRTPRSTPAPTPGGTPRQTRMPTERRYDSPGGGTPRSSVSKADDLKRGLLSNYMGRPDSPLSSFGGSEPGNFSCKCGYSSGTEAAMSRHLARNPGREHWQTK
jgi:hypothetical protein